MSSQTYQSFKKDFAERAGKAASITVLGGISTLIYHIGFPLVGLASMISTLIPLRNSINVPGVPAKDEPDLAM